MKAGFRLVELDTGRLKYILFTTLCVLVFAGFAWAEKVAHVACTTSFADAGIADALTPLFEKKFGARIKFISVGSGQALKMGEKKGVDAVIVHAKLQEEEFVRMGYGYERIPFMFNNFIIVGPPEDPAGIAGSSPVEAYRKMAGKKAAYLSRGDNSGTHVKETEIIRKAGINQTWFMESGQGMGQTLMIAGQKRAYTLADEATFEKFKNKINLAPLVKSENLKNVYSIIIVKTGLKERESLAATLGDYLKSSEFKTLLKSKFQFFYPVEE